MTTRIKKRLGEDRVSLQYLFGEAEQALKENCESRYNFHVRKLEASRFLLSIMLTVLLSRECSQREIVETLGSSMFAGLSKGHGRIKAQHSAVSYRLAALAPEYSRRVYQSLYRRVSGYYAPQDLAGFNVVAVDSTLVTETSARLSQGLSAGRNRNARGEKSQKQVKYTIGYDGVGACFADIFTEDTYLSENKALVEALRSNISPDDIHRNLYVLDRGLNSSVRFGELRRDGIMFVGRLNAGRRYQVTRTLPVGEAAPGCVVESDEIVRLRVEDKVRADSPELRLLKVNVGRSVMRRKGHRDRMDDHILLVTDALDMPCKDIIEAYRERWEIEVFFRFLKQNLSFRHFVSVNANGLETIMYCVLTLGLLMLLYSRSSGQSAKGAIFNLRLDLLHLIWQADIIDQCDTAPGDTSPMILYPPN